VNPESPHRSASEQLLDQLMEAARRDEALTQPPRRPRRRRRRAVAVLAAVLLGGAAAAGAADLISTGEPIPDRTVRGPRYDPAAEGAPALATKASDPTGAAAWGVGIYTSAAGEDCAVAGQVRGVELGQIRDGKFHPYERGTSGACANLSQLQLLSDRLFVRGAQPRTILYGRTSRPERSVTVDLNGKTYSARPARGGAFVFVFAGNLLPSEAFPRVGKPLRP
jgi:hypothetical protein